MNTFTVIPFIAIPDAQEAERHVVRVRFAEALARQSSLDGQDDEALHAFRLACKRLRFALERIEPQPSHLMDAVALLQQITDELGFAHDCAELAQLANESHAPIVAARARRDRDRYRERAKRLWRNGFAEKAALAPLASYAGFRWSTS